MDMNQPPMNRENNAPATPGATAARAAAELPALVPAVDVYEDENGITLLADLPGVSKENLTVRVEGDQLTIEGPVTLGESTKLDPVYAEVRMAHYRRVFALGRDLDTGKIDAKMKDGVLRLSIAKAEQAKPRRIPVAVS